MDRVKLKLTIPDSVSAKLQGMVSRGIAALEIDENGHLIVTLTDNTKVDLGKVKGEDGTSAFQAAVDGGYEGTEEDLNKSLATLPEHLVDNVRHISEEERLLWNDRYTKEQTDNLLKDKADTTTTNQLVKSISFSAKTGVFTIITQGGNVSTIDTLLERVPASFSLEGNQLVLTLEDGTRQTADLSAFIEDVLPKVTEEDNEKVLTAKDGEWKAEELKVGWEKIDNKPFKPVFHTYFEWSESYVPLDQRIYDEDRGLYKVSDMPLSMEELVGCVVEFTNTGGGSGSVTITENIIDVLNNGEVVDVDLGDYVGTFFGLELCSVYTTYDLGLSDLGIYPLDRGLWVAYDAPGVGDTITKIYTKTGEVLDEECLPPVKAEEVKFTKDLITTYEIGSISLENGQAVIPAEGKTLQEVWDTIFVTELPPTVEEPKVLLTVPRFKAYEVGERVETTYNVELSAGKYSYGPDTGITASAWSVKDTLGVELTSSVGEFSTLVVRDKTSYSITATATHGAGAIPFTNLGNEYPEGQIAAGEKSATSAKITGYRNGFYGTAADKKAAIDSSFVRGLASKSGKRPAAGDVWNLAIPVGAMRIVFAYPATIRDVSSVLDVNGLNAEIKSAFTKYTVSVEGANGYEGIDYKVYVLDRAAATTEANTFKITI